MSQILKYHFIRHFMILVSSRGDLGWCESASQRRRSAISQYCTLLKLN